MTHDPALSPYQQRAVTRAQSRIRADIEGGVVPPTVRDFSQLHDFVDANEYLLDDAGDFDAELEGLDVEAITRDVMGPVIDTLDAWLREGRHKHNGARSPNTVFMDVRARDGWRIGVLTAPHDGTRAGIVAAADRLQQRALARFSDHTHAGSRLFATDATGALGWVISPNLAHVSLYDSPEARETLGLPKRNGAWLIELADGTTLRAAGPVKIIDRLSMAPFIPAQRRDAETGVTLDAARIAALLPGATARGQSAYVLRKGMLVRIVSMTQGGYKHNGRQMGFAFAAPAPAAPPPLLSRGGGALMAWPPSPQILRRAVTALSHFSARGPALNAVVSAWSSSAPLPVETVRQALAELNATVPSTAKNADAHAVAGAFLRESLREVRARQTSHHEDPDPEQMVLDRESVRAWKRNGAAQPLPYNQRLRAWETAWAAYQASDQGNDAWEALEFACRFIGERNPIPPPPAFHWHRRPAGPARGPCPICGCGDARMKAEHRRVPGKGCEKETKVCFGADCNIERIPGPHRASSPKRNHAPGHGERVMAYWNLHKGQWSLKSIATGRVIARVPQVTLTGATFRVSEAGRQRVLREGVKNVHAGVVGVVGEGPRDGHVVAVRYNPRAGAHFTDRDSGRALVGAQTVSLNSDRSVTAWRPSYPQ